MVLKRFASCTDVLTAFDVDCCAFAYNGSSVLATARALRAVATKVNIVDLARRSQTCALCPAESSACQRPSLRTLCPI